MNLWVLIRRSVRSRNFLITFMIVSVLYLCSVFHRNRQSVTFQSIFYNLPYLERPNFFFRGLYMNGTKFIPGKFLNSVKPSNETFCNFRLGFPEFFEISDSDIDFSPELGEQGSYHIIYNVLQGSWDKNKTNSVTYCTHVTPDFLHYLIEIVIRWDGPISIAAFVPGYDASTTLCLIQKLCLCVPEMSRVTLHFVFPIDYPPEHISCDPVLSSQKCSLPSVVINKQLNTFRHREELIYPVNVARNVARISANTRFVLVSDIELVPSKHLVPRFQTMIPKLSSKFNFGKIPFKNLVFVIPVFEVENYITNIPDVKSELLSLYAQNKVVYFHRWICLHCQRFPGLQRWIHQSNMATDSTIQPLLIVRREFPYHRWEPIYIGTNEEPLYSELLSWEGRQDKMIQMHEMCLMRYRFVILDGAFLVHAPGMKRRNLDSPNNAQTAHYYSNVRHYDRIMRRITRRHGAKPGCKAH